MTTSAVVLRPMRITDYDAALALWMGMPGICLRDADSREATQRYLERNPGLSFVAMEENRLVGTILAGHDGRRGYVQHLAVAVDRRREGIGGRLVEVCLKALHDQGIAKAHLFVLADNQVAQAFWARLGWTFRQDVRLYSYSAQTNA